MSYNRGRGRGEGHYGHYNNRQSQSQQQNVDAFVNANSVPVEILGWNGASLTECINFISRKCRVIVSNYSVDENTGVLKGYVKNESQMKELLNWSGVKFAGQSLRFSRGASSLSSQMGGGSGSTGNTIETITHFLKSRYQPEIKLLNLASVKQDPGLQASGFFANISISSKFFPALMKIAGDLKLDVVSVDLSGNELSDLQTISTMATTFPKLQNLSLQRNNFQRIKVFESWRHKLNFLRELILTENPIVNQTNPTEIQNIKLELMKSFPRLVVLNGEVLRNEQALNTNLTFPFQAQQAMFFQDDNIRNVSTNFIANYLKLWDSNRGELMILYQNESQFSLEVDSSHPYLIETTTTNTTSGTDFGYYMPNSRNLMKTSSSKSRMTRLSIGQEQIFKSFNQIPKSHHDILSKPERFSMESYSYPALNGIVITIHGSFDEVAQPENLDHLNALPSGPRGRYGHHQYQSKNKKVPLSKKSFDRTFVVIPGPNGSMVVASDLLTIRPYSNSDAWNRAPPSTAPPQQPQPHTAHVTPGTSPAPPGAPTVADLPAEVKAKLNPVQQELLVKILLETKLNITYGLMLCEQSNWDYQLCSMNFKNSAATLPREAFV